MSHICATLRLFKAQAIATLLLMSMFLAVSTTPAGAQQSSGNFVINSVTLTGFQVVGNVLHATGTVTGTLAGVPFTTTITDFALQPVDDNPATPAVECSVLNLELGPLHLTLLGLHVDTSRICLELTATEGGGLLGDLLCSLAGGPGGLGIPLLPSPAQVNTLQSGLATLITEALAGLESAQANGDSVCTGECEILNLVLGPLDLSLLGLNVSLDDCEGGPVQVCISASRGEGILGDLLCGLAGPQLGNLTLADIAQLVNRAIVLRPGGFTNQEIAELRALLQRLVSR